MAIDKETIEKIIEKAFRARRIAREIVRDPIVWAKLEEKGISTKEFARFPWDYQGELKEIIAEMRAEEEEIERSIRWAKAKLGMSSYDGDE